MNIVQYSPEHRTPWDEFVRSSKNGTFLFERAYMDYHADRFVDASLIVVGDDGEWLAIMPASRDAELIVSHGGLTYGGFVTDVRMTAPRMLAVFETVGSYLKARGADRVLYKTIPHPYHRLPAEEDRYALFRAGARLVRCDVISALRPTDRAPVQERRRRAVKKARKLSVAWKRTDDLAPYWLLLERVLEERHGAKPVHSLAEITRLRDSFPENIRLYEARLGDAVVAGVLVYETDRVARAQYIAASAEGRDSGALDLLFETLVDEVYARKLWFEMGTSNENQGRVLNTGLVEQKEGFGARAIAHEFFEWPLR